MKLNLLPAPLFGLLACMLSHQAAGQPLPVVDIHPYQSQALIRLQNSDLLETIPAATAANGIVLHPGEATENHADSMMIWEKPSPLTELQVIGGNYAFFQQNYLATVSADGYLLYKGKMKFSPGVIGGVYFTKKENNELVVVNSDGRFFETGTIVSNIRLAGGNYYIDTNGQLTTFRSDGMIFVTKPGVSYADAMFAGGNYFVKQDGTVVTISAENGGISLPYKPAAPVNGRFMGGNYFVGQDNLLYTVTSTGNLLNNDPLPSPPRVLGYSFLILEDGSFIWVDTKGNPHTQAVKVSQTGSKWINSLGDLAPNSTYVPSRSN